ncbi:tRNA (adenosine(37)-N6)-threonylcarbamoyltransferase complex transferase subunit TsaD [Candidatus Nomurabacteria bacterium]|nr:tRNA (adenosine(37)-N6)-threonylcarbamoyltransferase complex transferase subunit TsaD [Candidatus Nomurabacteria bacterium]
MKILSIETSCDETAISILEAKGGAVSPSFRVLGDNVSSQIDMHIPYGGVYPALAKREHIKNLPLVLEKTLKEAAAKAGQAKLEIVRQDLAINPDIDAIAVTYGPGLEPALWTGIVLAKELGEKWGVPIIPVNHMEGHLLSVFGKNKGSFKIPKLKFPLLALLVSGGHTELVLVKKPASPRASLGGWMRYEILGETLDDAVGEAFDKVARMLGLPYPGGPQISKLAEERRKTKKQNSFSLPRPMLYTKDFNFSFSGLKTAVLYKIKDLEKSGRKLTQELITELAHEFENAAIECLTHKTKRAIEKYKIKTLIVGGGVSANQHLKSEIKKITQSKVKLFFPTKELSSDNSLMIGIAGYLQYLKNKKGLPKPESIKADGNLRL